MKSELEQMMADHPKLARQMVEGTVRALQMHLLSVERKGLMGVMCRLLYEDLEAYIRRLR